MDFERGIWQAAVDGDEKRVKKFLAQGVSANTKDSSGYTALVSTKCTIRLGALYGALV